MKLFIKNMVCGRCITAVSNELIAHGLHPATIILGEADIEEQELSPQDIAALDTALKATGFELIDDRKGQIIEKIKITIVNLVHHAEGTPRLKHSELIAAELHHDYSYLSKLFSEVTGTTIEQYILSQKAEKIKEYLVYDQLTLTQIADLMGYSSVAHLSAQFKKVTGFSPSHFKKNGAVHRQPLDQVGKS